MMVLKNTTLLAAMLAFSLSSAAQSVGNWRNGDNTLVWKNGTNEHCWRSSDWTPATAASGCDGAIVPKPLPVATAIPQPQEPALAPVQPSAPPPVAVVPMVASKVTYAADAFFDFDRAVLKPAGRATLDNLVSRIQGVNLEVVIVVGHTDSVGSRAYNERLSLRRSEAVKAYLVSKGLERNRVYSEGKGEESPVADNRTSKGRALNRRVEIEVVGSR